MTEQNQIQLGKTLWAIADQLRGAMDADDFRDYMLSFLFLRYLSDNYEIAAKKELGQIVTLQGERLFEAMCVERQWPVADWRLAFHQHPVMRRLIERLVWQGLDAEGQPLGLFDSVGDDGKRRRLALAAAQVGSEFGDEIGGQARRTAFAHLPQPVVIARQRQARAVGQALHLHRDTHAARAPANASARVIPPPRHAARPRCVRHPGWR